MKRKRAAIINGEYVEWDVDAGPQPATPRGSMVERRFTVNLWGRVLNGSRPYSNVKPDEDVVVRSGRVPESRPEH